MKFLLNASNQFSIYLQQLSSAIIRSTRPKKRIYNLGATFEVEDLISYRVEELPECKFVTLNHLSDTKHLRDAVRNILIPRIVGTEGHKKVRSYIENSLRALDWSIEVDKFTDTVPIFGKLQFHNVIAKLNPDAERYLVLACHYDSKYMPGEEFLGATDSAVPCAMLLNLAKVLNSELDYFRSSKLSLMLLFFDGEEAFEEWGPTDSIYGARHLANKWDKEGFHSKIDMLVLLDLIGAPDPTFYSFFPNTESWYSRLFAIEERLSRGGALQRYVSNGVAPLYPYRYFQPSALSSHIEDDHLPFLKRRVPVLHIIPTPFPSVWHTINDNEAVIDYVTTENIGQIIRIFTMEYLLGSVEIKDD